MQAGQAQKNLEAAKASYDETTEAVKTAAQNWGNAQSTIEYYQDAMSASTQGNAKKMNDALLSMQYGLVNHTTASKKELDQQFLNTKKDLEDIQELYKNGNVSVELVNDYKRVNQLAGAELDKWVAKNGQAATDSVNALNNGLSNGLSRVTVTSGELGMGSKLAFIENLGDWDEIAGEKTDAYIGALDGRKADANKTGGALGQEAATGLESRKAEFKAAGDNSASEYTGALDSHDNEYKAAGETAAGTAADGAKSKEGEFKVAADDAANIYKNTIHSYSKDFDKTGEEAAETTASGAADKVGEFEKSADKAANQFVITIDGNSGKFKVTGQNMTDSTAEGAEGEASKMQTPAEKAVSEFAQTIENNKSQGYDAGAALAGEAVSGSDSKAGDAENSGKNFAQGFINGIGSLLKDAWNKAKELSESAWGGLKTGQDEGSPSRLTHQSGLYFGEGYINGIKETTKAAVNAAADLGIDAIKSLRDAQQEGSPSKLTYKSGRNFTKGFINGIASLESQLQATCKSMVKSVLAQLVELENFDFNTVATNASNTFASALTKKLEYTNGWIQYNNDQMLADFDAAITDLQKKSDNEIKAAQKASEKAQTKAQKASEKVQKKLQKDSDKVQADITKQSEAKQKELQKQIDKIKAIDTKKRTSEQKKQLTALEKELKEEKSAVTKRLKDEQNRVKKAITSEQNATKKQLEAEQKNLEKTVNNIKAKYDEQITTQQNMKNAYQRASSEMTSEFSRAMTEYQNAAQDLIDSTMEGITSKYDAQYDALINKQDTLIAKLKDAGDMFNLSNANLMTTNDIKAQTEQINRYASKLKAVKAKVSNELFEQIAGYDMKEGEAFIDRLLSMSAAELNAYNKAYTEKLNAADKLAQEIYKSDFDKIASDYEKEVNTAFSGLESQLEEIGKECLQGFVSGLTENTAYMSDSIKTFINGMIDTFKKQLGIHSPSKVTKKLGAYTAEGFADGIAENTDMVTDAIDKMTASIENSFDFSRLSLIDGFSDAITNFEQQAKTVLTKSVSNIGSTYQTKFNEILNKQENFTKKLQSTGELFTLSSANVMRVTDLNEQIKDLQTYAASLNKIKGKVSSQLFEQITTYNMEEGQAFIERLLAMSEAELKAYSNAYDKKLSLSEQLSENLYKNDLNNVAKAYDTEIEKAFATLPATLKTIGTQTMAGFLEGLGGDSKYVNESVQSIVNNMVAAFKTALGIHSPSKVMQDIGELTGEGFTNGLMSMIKAVKDAAQEITDTVTSSLDWQGDISGARGTLKEAAGATGLNRSAGTFEGSNTQIINFNQTNNSPKALDRLTLYRQTNNMLFNAKVRLSDV